MFQASVTSSGGASRRSQGSRYHTTSRVSRVDEALFGDPAPARLRKEREAQGGAAGAAAAHGGDGGDEPRGGGDGGGGDGRSPSGRRAFGSGAASAAGSMAPPVVLTSDDVFNMQCGAVIKSAEELRADKAAAAVALRERQAVADARKDKIKSLEAARIANLPKSLLEQEAEAERARRLHLAHVAKDEALDDVKKMNSIFNYALTVTIRDRQLAEKKERAEQDAAREKMRGLQAEIDALEAQHRSESADEAKRGGRDKYRADVLAQLHVALGRKKAQREAMMAEEAARKASFAVVLEAEKTKAEEALRRKAADLQETLLLNEAAIQAKKARKQAERELEEKADREAIEMDRNKAAAEAERERVRQLKEEASARDRGSLAKFNDDSEAKLELGMQRAFEEGARRERLREVERARRQAAALEDLKATRVRMLEEKQVAMASMIEDEKAEFEVAQRLQQQWLEQQVASEQARSKANFAFLKDVRGQVSEKDSRAQRAKEVDRQELARAQAEYSARSGYLRSIRDAKVAEMKAIGLPGSYTTELARYDPDVEMARNSMTVAKRQEKIAPLPPPGKGGSRKQAKP